MAVSGQRVALEPVSPFPRNTRFELLASLPPCLLPSLLIPARKEQGEPLYISAMSRFDKEALIWDSKPEVVQSTQAFYETLKKRIPRLSDSSAGLSILDLGCGTGLVSQRLAECEGVAKVVGVDTSKGMVEV